MKKTMQLRPLYDQNISENCNLSVRARDLSTFVPIFLLYAVNFFAYSCVINGLNYSKHGNNLKKNLYNGVEL